MSKTVIKRCTDCKQIKSLSEFNKDESSKDGLQYKCKSCYRDYQQSPKGKAVNRKAQGKYRKTPKGKTANQAAQRRFCVRHPERRKAKNAITCAITAGKLPRPDTLQCHYCPKPAQQYHHWHGYEKEHRLDVVPVCILCHSKIRRKVA